MKTKQFIFIVAALFLFLTVHPQTAYCEWDDKSDELPGMSGGTAYLIAGGVVITGLITYFIIKKKKKNKSTSYYIGDQYSPLLASSFHTESNSFYDEMKKASQKSSVELFTGDSNAQTNNINTALSVGLRFKF